MLKTPILFITFNKPDATKKVFEQIRKAQPKKLFITQDGIRKNNENDKKNCELVRNIIKKIDWNCEVKTLFREKNMGCKIAISSAIDWFFDNVEQGIILEDDCLPCSSFFSFCEEMLEKYKDNEKIAYISGSNYEQEKTINIKESYYFSKYGSCWGWALWSRAWKKYDVNIRKWSDLQKNKETKNLKNVFNNFKTRFYWALIFNDIFYNRLNAFDYQVNFMMWANNMLTIVPKNTLIINIGIGNINATNTNLKSNIDIQTKELTQPLIHPKNITVNEKFDIYTQKKRYILWKQIVWKILNDIKLLNFIKKILKLRIKKNNIHDTCNMDFINNKIID